MTREPARVQTKPRINLTEALQGLNVGETIRFPLGTNYGSLRTLATVNHIRVQLRSLDSGEIEVTRRPDKRTLSEPKGELYDL